MRASAPRTITSDTPIIEVFFKTPGEKEWPENLNGENDSSIKSRWGTAVEHMVGN